jgi:hypothetical protein
MFSKLTRVVLSGVALSLVIPSLIAAQTPPKTNPPDITGVWAILRAGRGADPKLVAPPPTEMVLKPAYAKPYEARRAAEREGDQRGEPLANGGTACIPYGMPQMMSAIYPLEFLQSRGQVTIVAEAFSEVRRIYLDQPQEKMGDVAPGFYGSSVGRWEGDTLTVDTIGVKPSVLSYQRTPHSDQMRIRERMTLVAPDVLHDQITVDDPVVLEKPWTFTFAYRKMAPTYKMLEYVCENNRDYIDENGVTRLKLKDK